MNHIPTQTHSNWWNGPEHRQPPLQDDLTIDVAIIGGGFTGLHTALALRKAGVEVAILEREFAGAGASGKSAGYVDGLIGKDLPSLLKVTKLQRARELCDFAREVVVRLEDLIESEGIDCDYVDHGNINVAVHPRQTKRLQKLVAAGKDLGMEYTFLDGAALRERGIPEAFVSGVHDPHGGVLNPGKLVRRLRQMAIDAGVKLYEGVQVLRVRNGDPVLVETEGATVTARQVVLATNAFTMQLGWKKRFMAPIWNGMLESEPLSAEQREQLRWPGEEGLFTAHEKLESYRLTKRNTLIAGGKVVHIPYGFKLTEIAPENIASSLEKVFRQRFPQLADLKFQAFWGGWIGIPLDFLPGIGSMGKHKNIHYGMGYAGHGIPQTLLVGEILAAKILRQPHPFETVLDRRTLPIPPEPFKWLVSNLVDKALGIPDKKTDRLVSGGR